MTNENTAEVSQTHPLDLKHFVLYGQPGDPQQHHTKSSDWKHKPIVQRHRYIIPNRTQVVGDKDVQAVLNGFRPQEMEDKWFIFTEEGRGPDEGKARTYLVRSWTGLTVAEVEWLRESGEVEAIVFDSQEEKKVLDTGEEAWEHAREVFRWVLGVDFSTE